MTGADSSLVKKAARLRIKALTLAGELKTGSFRSLYRGSGIEFSGVREYLPGDDVRAIDWNVTSRMARPFVKVFQEERELQLFVLVDFSRSMRESGALAPALEGAALLALAAGCASCPVGALSFADRILFSRPPRSAGVMEILARFDALAADGRTAEPGTALPDALSFASRLLRKRALAFVFSDFRAAAWERPLALLASRHDVAAVRAASLAETQLPAVARVSFRDPETGLTQSLPTSSPRFRREWREYAGRKQAYWRGECASRGAYPLALSPAEDPFAALSRFFSRR